MRAIVVATVLLGGALLGSLATPHRLADASSFVLMTDSLLHDRDLRYERADLERARALRFDDLPAGLLLVKRADGAYAYGKPALYPLAALPWYAALGVRGFQALNGLLLGALVLLGARVLAPALGWLGGGAAAAAVYAFSVVPIYVLWIDPFLLLTVLVASGVAAHRAGRPALAGAAFGAVAACRFPYAALAVAPLVLSARARRFPDAFRFLAGAGAAALGIAALTYASAGQWSAYTGERYYYAGPAPFETAAETGHPFSRDGLLAEWRLPEPRRVVAGLFDFVAGRAAGVLLYFPTFFACLLWARRWDLEKTLWLSAVAGFALALELTIPHNRTGGAHALGNRFFVLLPVALCFVDGARLRSWRVVLSLGLALLAVPILREPARHSRAPGRVLLAWPHRLFPFEWPLAEHVSYPARFPGLFALSENQYQWEPASGGVWTVGGARAEFVLVRPRDTPARVRLWSLLPEARITDGRVVRTVRFDRGPHEITLAHPMSIHRNEYGERRELAVYRLAVETDAAFRPAEAGRSPDQRALGVSVQPLS